MKNKGITLIALVITIIVLLILAAVSIATLTGENGILTQATRAGEETNNATEKEQIALAYNAAMGDNNGKGVTQSYFETELKKYDNGITVTKDEENDNFKVTYPNGHEYTVESNGSITGPKTGETLPEEQKNPQIKDKLGEVIDSDKNTTVYDEYNNPVEVPAGFKIVPNGKYNVEYKYSETNLGIPTVQDGIVVEDEEENQFVWIPVGKIINKNDSEKKTTEIKLARRVFDESGRIEEETETGDSIGYDEFVEETEEEHELNKDNLDNAIAKDIELFKSSAKTNHGYYIARYEASMGDDGKAKSKQGKVWNKLTQIEASNNARTMYNENIKFESDLINSYAWDTAIVFIQEYSGFENYSIQNAKNYEENKENPDETGERNYNTTDKVCNIYDMASNCKEFSTETNKTLQDRPYYDYLPAVLRGGSYDYDGELCESRRSAWSDDAYNIYGFRVNLYILN